MQISEKYRSELIGWRPNKAARQPTTKVSIDVMPLKEH